MNPQQSDCTCIPVSTYRSLHEDECPVHGEPKDSLSSVEGICDQCTAHYTTPWYAENELWNKVNGSPNGMLCPNCFIANGNRVLGPQIWKVVRDA